MEMLFNGTSTLVGHDQETTSFAWWAEKQNLFGYINKSLYSFLPSISSLSKSTSVLPIVFNKVT